MDKDFLDLHKWTESTALNLVGIYRLDGLKSVLTKLKNDPMALF